MKVKPIILMLCYARSGGTLLNRCFSCIPKTTVFSEINPEAVCPTKISTLVDQSKHWYNFNVNKGSFVDEIKQIKKFCDKNGNNLIIRDWNFGSFVPLKYNSFKPSSTLAFSKVLEKEKIDKKEFAFVRNAKDIWLSMHASNKPFHDRQLNYLYKFIKTIKENNIKTFKYEDFCLNPVSEMKKICKYLKITYSPLFLNYNLSLKATGDIDSSTPSRGIEIGKITLLPRRNVHQEIIDEIEKNTMANQINKILGYQ